ncbi:MAG TPA: methylenetetrahydrofolate reductase [Spirochaetia bacterium]|nr:methylenetetrahydrofolate reductase [Spirochaetia bacterium]
MLFRDSPYIIELLTPKQADEDFESKLDGFAQHYRAILDHDAVVSICDNPLGNLRFTAMEVAGFLDLPVDQERTLLHLNSFHRKEDLDGFLREARERGIRHLLAVSGDGGPRLPRLEPSELGFDTRTVTSVEILRYIEREHPGFFSCGVAFNQYEPAEHELEKLRRKLDAGAKFVITQPVVCADVAVEDLLDIGVPVFVGAWMSKRLDPLCECVGVKKPENAVYDPAENLACLDRGYPGCGLYLAQLGFKRDWAPLLTRTSRVVEPVHLRTLPTADP